MTIDRAAAAQLSTRFLALSAERRRDFLARLRESGLNLGLLPIPAGVGRGSRALSFAQERLWFLAQLEPESSAYNMSAFARLTGELDLSVLERCLAQLVERHATLRTRFVTVDGVARAELSAGGGAILRHVELSNDGRIPDAVVRQEAERVAAEPFVLERDDLLRAVLFRTSAEEYVLVLVVHHIVSDGWSMNVLMAEFVELYSALSRGRVAALPSLGLRYEDYAYFQRSVLEAGELECQLEFWKARLAGEQTPLALPSDRPRPAIQSYRGAKLDFALPNELSLRVREGAREQSVTPFMFLLATFVVLLSRHAQRRSLRVGVPVANRDRLELEGVVGLLLNTLVLPFEVAPEQSFSELLREVRETTLEAQSHAEVPFEKLVEALQLERSLSHSPLFQVMFNHQQRRTAVLGRLPGLRIEALRWDAETTQFDLSLDTEEDEEGRIHATFSYSSDLFDRSRIERFAQHWLQLLKEACASPHRALRELRVLPDDERERLQRWSRGPQQTFSSSSESPLGPLLAAIEQHVSLHPDAEALVSEGERLSYGALWAQAGALAARLRQQGIRRESRVGLSVERSVRMVVGLLGILRSGGAFVPLDPGYPAERLRLLARDAGLALLVIDSAVRERLGGAFAALSCIDLDCVQAGSSAECELGCEPILGEQLAYVIYTSGSTGQPKGVAVSHGAIARHCRAIGAAYGMTPSETMLQFASISFDGALDQWLAPLMHGSRVVIRGPELWSAEQAFQVLRAERVTIADFLPAYLLELSRWLFERGRVLPLRVCAVGGEALPREGLALLRQVMGDAVVINGYGPTEAVVTPTVWIARSSAEDAAYAPIGAPIGDRTAYVLDAGLEMQPIGVMGELYLGGPTLARGYAGKPGFTAARFVPDPFGEAGGRLYRTGDLARFGESGELEYVGRADRQIKLRGYRIEQGEIESALRAEPGVREAAVLVQERGQTKQLVAYLAGDFTRFDEQAVKASLALRLPDFMVPSELVVLPSLPRTANGKLDERALPTPSRKVSERRPPRSPAEVLLAQIWRATLGVSEVSLDDNFFELGGDSIVSIQVVSRARAKGLELTPRDVFQHQTLERLALVARASDRQSARDQGPLHGTVLLSPVQSLFFRQEIPNRNHYNQAVLLAVRGTLDVAALRRALGWLIAHHDALRLRFREVGAAIEQSYSSVDAALRSLVVWEERAANGAEVTAICQRAQRSLELTTGPLLRAVHIQVADAGERLLLVVHHLAVDGVSFRVLLEDLEALYDAALQEREPALPEKASSYAAWSAVLGEFAAKLEQPACVEYWESALAFANAELPRDGALQRGTNRQAQTVVVRLSIERTEQLLRAAPRAYRSRVDELLLAALGRAVCAWAGNDHALIEVETHGREPDFGLDLSRSVGWFTALYPLCLPAERAIADSIRSAKERIRGVPERGLGFLVMRELGSGQTASKLRALPAPRITFNYLGQFDQALGAREQRFELAREHAGDRLDPSAALDNWLVVNGQVFGSVLELGFTFGSAMFRAETVERLAQGFIRELEAVVEHCLEAEGLTPSDFPLARLTQAELDDLSLEPSAVEDVYPLTPMQQGMLFHSRLSPELGTYVNQLVVELGGLDVPRFEAAWNRAIARHAVLRTSFAFQDGGARPLQIVHRSVVARIEVQDLRAIAAPEAALLAVRQREHEAGFDLKRPLLSKFLLARTGERTHRLVWTLHHLILDGWSSARLLSEVLDDYAGRPLAAMADGGYRDYLAWLERQDLAAAERYFRERLALLPGPTLLGASVSGARGGRAYGEVACLLEGDAFQRARRLVDALRVTLSTLVQGALSLLLARYTGQSAVALGLTVAGRPVELRNVEATLGLFINTLPAVCALNASERVVDYLRRVQDETLALRSYEWTPLYEIQAWAGQSGRSLFDTLLVFENYPIDQTLRPTNFGVSISNVEVTENTNYPLTVSVHAAESALKISLRYDLSVFSEPVAAQLATQLSSLLAALVTDGATRIGSLGLAGAKPILPPEPLQPQLVLDAIAQKAPATEALFCKGSGATYGELLGGANGVASALVEVGVRSEDRVGVLVERSVGLVVGLLGVLKSGGAFVPLDVSYPAERLRLMMEDAGVRVVVSSAVVRERLEGELSAVKWVDVEQGSDRSGPRVEIASEQLAYVIYTSGSTGRPKGVGVTHGALSRHCAAIGAEYGLQAGETMLAFASMNFDGSLDQWLAPLVHGARVVLRGPELWDAEQTLSVLERERVSVADFLPSYLLELGRYAEEHGRVLRLRVCAVGGEALSREGLQLVQRVAGGARVINGYGPTEAVVTPLTWTASATGPVDTAYAPIGKPIGDRTAYVLDGDLNLLPEGVVGELYVGGPTLARGYEGRADLTAERFIPDPFSVRVGGRLYRTGDLARQQSDGSFEYVGRGDEQVKLRGYRVELGEVESELLRESEVSAAVVLVREGPKRLVAYAVLKSGAEVGGNELRERLVRRLPEYLVPADVVLLAELPRTLAGKVDKRRLPEVERAAEKYRAPESELERQLAVIWQEVLQVERVGVDDNFFDLGGHSILAMRVVGRVRSELHVSLPLALLFESATVRELAQQLEPTLAEQRAARSVDSEIASALEAISGLDDDQIARLLAAPAGDE